MGIDRSIESHRANKWQGDESTSRSLSRAQYAEHKLGIKMWPKLQAIYDLIDLGCSKLLIRSCNGAGKSTLLASLIVEELQLHDDVQVICTASTATQLKETLWRAVKKLARAGRISVDDFNATSWDLAANRRAIAISPAKVEGGQGYHAERVVVVIDEATSMETDKITALLSNATGQNALVVFTYNPIKPDAMVYDLEAKAIPFEELLTVDMLLDTKRASMCADRGEWISIGINAFEHPNIIEGREVIPGAVTREFVESVMEIDSVQCNPNDQDAIVLPWKNKAYRATPEVLARICGEWSDTQAIGFISGSVVVNSWAVETKSGLKYAGADIGGGDDPSVWTSFRGNTQMAFNTMQTSELGIVAQQLHTYCMNEEIDVLGIDDTGVGHGVTDRLQGMNAPYKIVPINFSNTPKNFPEVAIRKPANARCEMYLLLEKAMRSEDIKVLYDKELQRELTCQKILGLKNGTIRLEDKSLIKKRIGRSPNKADATAIALYAARLLQYYNRPRIY